MLKVLESNPRLDKEAESSHLKKVIHLTYLKHVFPLYLAKSKTQLFASFV